MHRARSALAGVAERLRHNPRPGPCRASQTTFRVNSLFVLLGIETWKPIFAALVLVGEGVLWPAEQRLQVALAGDGAAAPEPLQRDASTMARAAVVALVLLVAGTVLMLAQP